MNKGWVPWLAERSDATTLSKQAWLLRFATQPTAPHRLNTVPIQLDAATPITDGSYPPGVIRLDYRSGVDGLADWALALPADRGDTWVVNIHGRGSHGDQLYTREDIKRDWLSAFRNRGLGILTPNLRDDAWMSPATTADLRGLLDMARSRFNARRFVFVSGSMGGTSTLIYAVLHPEDVTAAAAMCPATDLASLYNHYRSRPDTRPVADAMRAVYGGSPDERPQAYQGRSCLQHADRLTMPVYVAHGDADGLIPVTESRALAAACRGHDRFKYREIPGGDHDSPLASEILNEALEWVLGDEPSAPGD